MDKIEEYFKDPKKGLVGVDALYKKMKNDGIDVSKNDVKKSLSNVESYSLNKSVKRNGKTRKTISRHPNQQWQADLVEMDVPQGAPASDNDGIRYLITVVDVFSRYAWVRALKNKKGETITKAIIDIFKEGRKPRLLQTDQGSEFYNSIFQKFLDSEKIKLFSTYGDRKATIVERFNRTLKMRMGKLFDVRQDFRYIDDLEDLVDNYNNTYHTTIKMTPTQAQDPENIIEVFANIVGNNSNDKKEEPKYKVGDYVRLQIKKGRFSKEMIGSWTIEFFKISKVLDTNPITYKIIDLKDEEVKGSFYDYELNEVSKSALDKPFRIEKILDRKGKKVLVQYLGWPSKFNEWKNKD